MDAPQAASPWSAVKGGVRVAVKLAPKASANAVDGVGLGENGPVLKARVTAAPEDGKANAALIKLLAKEWGLPARAMDLIAGATARNKLLRIAGEPAELAARLDDWRRRKGF